MRASWIAVCVWIAALGAGGAPRADPATVAPVLAPSVHALGVDAPTAAAFELLLVQEIERLGTPPLVHAATSRPRPCADADCAARRARHAGAPAALLCTLSRFGAKHVAALQVVDVAGRVGWSRRVASPSANGLDSLAVELAAGLAGRRPEHAPSSRPADTERAWTGSGPRVGLFYPLGATYADASRLTSVAFVWRYQTPRFNVESVPVLGLAWGGDLASERGKARDWTLLDVYVTWTPLAGNIGPYLGAGLGLHAVRMERDGGLGDPFQGRRHESATTLAMALGGGVTLFRTYDFQIALDLRYVRLAHDFPEVGGHGGQGLMLTFGVQH